MASLAQSRAPAILTRSLALALALTLAQVVSPAQAHAADLFPVDDWVGEGLGQLKDTAFGGIEIGAEAIAELIVNTIAAIVDLLIPKSFIEAGVSGIRWICTVPAFTGGKATSEGAILTLPHVDELRTTLQWFGITLLPLGLAYSGVRYFIPGSAYDDGPIEIVGNVILAAAWLALYLWGWTAIAGASSMLSEGILSMPWVDEGVEQLMETLTLNAAATGPISEFAVLVLLLIVAIALIGLLLLKIALLVITAFLFAIGGLVGALLPFPFGRRLVQGYLVAVVAVVALPALWAVVFALGSALMLDVSTAGDDVSGFEEFMTEFWILGASVAIFGLAIKLGFQGFGFATSAVTSFAQGGLIGGGAGGGGGSAPSASQAAHRVATIRNMQGRGAQQAAFATAGGAAAGRANGASIQNTREAAEGLRGAVGSSRGAATTAATAAAGAATGGASAAAGAAGKSVAAHGAAAGAAGKGAGASAADAAAQRAPIAAASRHRAGGGAQTPPLPSQSGDRSIRSTSPDDVSARPRSAAQGPRGDSERASARTTPIHHKDAGKGAAPSMPRGAKKPAPGSKQSPPRGPRPSSGGQR